MAHKKSTILSMLILFAWLAACTSPNWLPTRTPTEIPPSSGTERVGTPGMGIARHPRPADYSFINRSPKLPKKYDPNSENPFQNDYRAANLTRLDLSQSLEGLLYSNFDSDTRWPAADQLPAGFDPQAVLERGKDPGLGVRTLHSQGITGRGVGIAIIDQTLLVDHQEYADRLKWYEETNCQTCDAQMHGPAVASIAVGKTVGVALEADLYYLADNTMNKYAHLGTSIRRVIEFNQTLPEGHKIRVLSMSIGWMPDSPGVDEVTAAVNEAKAAGIFVIDVDLSGYRGMYSMGLGRSALDDPNDFNTYLPSPWWSENYYKDYQQFLTWHALLLPMDARTTASPTGTSDYAFYPVGGMSWVNPYLAGMYALACQVKPDITPEDFWSKALATGRTIHITHGGNQYSFGTILDAQALIAALQK